MEKVFSLNFASVVATFTPKKSGIQPIVLKADVFWTDDEMLGKPIPDKPRAKYFASNDGKTGQYIDMFAKSGNRTAKLMDSLNTEKLISWANTNPQPLFDFSFFYLRNDSDQSEARTQFHKDCKFLEHPVRVISNEVVSIEFLFQYALLQTLDANGVPLEL